MPKNPASQNGSQKRPWPPASGDDDTVTAPAPTEPLPCAIFPGLGADLTTTVGTWKDLLQATDDSDIRLNSLAKDGLEFSLGALESFNLYRRGFVCASDA